MAVLRHGPCREVAVVVARDDHRDLAPQVDHPLEHAGVPVHPGERAGHVFARTNPNLPLAVVAEARAFHDAGQERRIDARDVGAFAQNGERRNREAMTGNERLFADAILRDGNARGTGRDAQFAREELECRGGHVLELGGRRPGRGLRSDDRPPRSR